MVAVPTIRAVRMPAAMMFTPGMNNSAIETTIARAEMALVINDSWRSISAR